MPLYEYKCQSCGTIFEVIQKFSDEPLKVHDGCGGAVERLLSPPAFQFKGTGWYVTDYARSGNNGKSQSRKPSLSESPGEAAAKAKEKASEPSSSGSEK